MKKIFYSKRKETGMDAVVDIYTLSRIGKNGFKYSIKCVFHPRELRKYRAISLRYAKLRLYKAVVEGELRDRLSQD